MDNWFTRNNVKVKSKNIYQLLSLCGVNSFDEYILDINQELVESQNRYLNVEDFVEVSVFWMQSNKTDKHVYYKSYDDLYDHEIEALQLHLDRIINT